MPGELPCLLGEEHENPCYLQQNALCFIGVAPHLMLMLMSAVLLPGNLWLRLMEIDIYNMSSKNGYENAIELH